VRVTLDSNAYISALQFGGRAIRLFRMALEGSIEIAVSEPILDEVSRVTTDENPIPLLPFQLDHIQQILVCLRLPGGEVSCLGLYGGPSSGNGPIRSIEPQARIITLDVEAARPDQRQVIKAIKVGRRELVSAAHVIPPGAELRARRVFGAQVVDR
jgi:hypothetical protein